MTNQEAVGFYQIGGSPVSISFSRAEILALENLVCEVIENPQSQTSLPSDAKSSVTD